MQQRSENFNTADEDPEATLVAPRFDANDARHAHAVVPLVETPPRTPYANAHASHVRRARTPRRIWTTALLAVALLAVAAVGGAVATKVIQSPRAERVEEQTQADPVQTAEAPTQPPTPQATEAPREDAPAARRATHDTRTRRAQTVAAALAAAAPAREDADDAEDDKPRDKKAEKRREHEDDVEKEMRKALKRAKGKAPRLIDVLTSP
ncbi:MAG: hypothetical protein QOH49_1069 [Acidobacteriota bacterium]|jgi:type IV secretory pathway TrbF-like protein|nr:hypothetical protein [Acidobacteriota bacterium]